MRFHRPAHGTIVAYTALVVALGGTSYAAVTVTGQQVKNSSLTGLDVKNGTLTGNDIKKKSVPVDRLSGGLPTGPVGPVGPAGPRGLTGEPDYTRVYDKPAADARFLAKGAKAVDADTLDGLDSSAYARGNAVFESTTRDVAQASSETLLTLPGWGTVAVLNCNASFANVGLSRDSSGSLSSLWTSSSATPAGGSAGTNWASAGSYSAPSGWVRYTLAKASAVADIEVHGRWNGAGCTFAITAARYTN
jgi:hypothetical protein